MDNYASAIREYDDMLLLADSKYAKKRMVGSGRRIQKGEVINDRIELRQKTALAVCRHVVEDLIGWETDAEKLHLNYNVAKMYHLERVICAAVKDKEKIQNYGFLRFDKLENVNFRYLLSLMYPGIKIPYGENRYEEFSYPKEAIYEYKKIIASRDASKRGASSANTRLSKLLYNGISLEDENRTRSAFFGYFVNNIVADQISPSKYGRAYDLYKFFSNEKQIASMVAEAGLKNVFNVESNYMSYYDLLCENMELLCPHDDNMFYCKVFSYRSAALSVLATKKSP